MASGDPNQCAPPPGSSVWISPRLLTEDKLHHFCQYIRMHNAEYRPFLKLITATDINTEDMRYIKDKIRSSCPFVCDETNVQSTVLRLYGKCSAER